MSDEVTVRAQLTIKKDNLDFRSNPTVFKADLNTAKPPTPGLVNAVVSVVTAVDLSKLTNPGMCWIQNLGDAAGLNTYVDVGLYDVANGKFRPFMELKPGEFYPFCLSRNFGEEENVPAPTGTSVGTNEQLAVLAYGASASVCIWAFEAD